MTDITVPAIQPFLRNRFQQALLAVYVAVWTWGAINPHDRADWLLENLLVFAAAGFSVWLYRRYPLSNTSTFLIVTFMVLHTIGSHYTYSLVPFGDWMKDAGGFERNHYDRVIHFTFGLLLSYPIREFLLRAGHNKGFWLNVVVFLLISTFSGVYELMEWAAAAIVAPETGIAFLGTQGDPFDSQKDHALALLGCVIALMVAIFAENALKRRARRSS